MGREVKSTDEEPKNGHVAMKLIKARAFNL
jgi:hypothetical protein